MSTNADNNSGYINYNLCRSFNQRVATTLTMLTGANPPGITNSDTPSLTGGFPCSEIIIINRTEDDVVIYDNGFTAATEGLLISTGESVTLRGLTNVAQVSATAVAAGDVHYRTQFYSINPSR